MIALCLHISNRAADTKVAITKGPLRSFAPRSLAAQDRCAPIATSGQLARGPIADNPAALRRLTIGCSLRSVFLACAIMHQ
jgi:hypothetical protein